MNDFEEYIKQGEPQKKETGLCLFKNHHHKLFKVQKHQAKPLQSAKFAL